MPSATFGSLPLRLRQAGRAGKVCVLQVRLCPTTALEGCIQVAKNPKTPAEDPKNTAAEPAQDRPKDTTDLVAEDSAETAENAKESKALGTDEATVDASDQAADATPVPAADMAENPASGALASDDVEPAAPLHPQDTGDSPDQAGPAPTAMPPAPADTTRKGGFVPMVLGGFIAAALGFGAAQTDFLAQQTGQPTRAEMQARLEQLQAAVSSTQSRTETVEQQLADLSRAPDPQADIAARIDALEAAFDGQVQALQAQLDQLAQRPAGAATPTDTSALEAQLDQLRSSVAALTSAADTQRQAAELSARQSLIRASMNNLRAALETGASLQPALNDLAAAGVELPSALADMAEGVPTLASLQARFVPAARAALAQARTSGAEGTALGIFGFLQAQLGVRSLQPKEGDGPDAVLSRIEAALAAGDLAQVSSLAQALPNVAQAALADWLALAEQRRAAMAALADLAQTETGN